MSTEQQTILDIDALMDADMGSVETLPEYVNLAKGVYRLKCTKAETYKREAKGDKGASAGFRVTYELLDTKECEEPPFPNGSLCSTSFTANEMGLKMFKRHAMGLLNVTSLDGVKLNEVLESMVGAEVDTVITLRTSTGDNGKVYENTNYRFLHDSPAA